MERQTLLSVTAAITTITTRQICAPIYFSDKSHNRLQSAQQSQLYKVGGKVIIVVGRTESR